MTSQLELGLGDNKAPAPGLSWYRDGGIYHGCGARHDLLLNGAWTGSYVKHCGHPTAIRPYYVVLAGGAEIERKFAHLIDAQLEAIANLDADPEIKLRGLWNLKGVPGPRQEEMIREIVAKAQPGARVGPFIIGGKP